MPETASRTRTGALVEDLRSQMALVLDGIHGVRTSLERKIDESEARTGLRLDVLELSVRHLSGEVP